VTRLGHLLSFEVANCDLKNYDNSQNWRKFVNAELEVAICDLKPFYAEGVR